MVNQCCFYDVDEEFGPFFLKLRLLPSWRDAVLGLPSLGAAPG
jgi:hypothetical protein